MKTYGLIVLFLAFGVSRANTVLHGNHLFPSTPSEAIVDALVVFLVCCGVWLTTKRD